jgi:hypothetical protein
MKIETQHYSLRMLLFIVMQHFYQWAIEETVYRVSNHKVKILFVGEASPFWTWTSLPWVMKLTFRYIPAEEFNLN